MHTVSTDDIFTSSFRTVFSEDDDILESVEDQILTITPAQYEMMWTSGGIGTVIYLSSLRIWTLYLKSKAKELDQQFSNIRDTVKKMFDPDNEKNDIELLQKFYQDGIQLSHFMAETGKLDRDIKNYLKDFIAGQTSYSQEIPVVPSSLTQHSTWISQFNQYSNSGASLKIISNAINFELKQLQNILTQLDSEYQNIQKNLNDIMSLRTRKTSEKQGSITAFASMAILILTSILAFDVLNKFFHGR